ncbi:hypothetical protein [Candidatus Uabimicrobium amorphum]|uniref:Uncharacterized protein n=1 Tax=Uabimicrobium amorphum TaxID=2596890 RepID=A0A5S9F4W8_UABAM|nr:hypothetical protein [Candidatus Uabimicrobium amorphum]BBM86226.1 hypothetical protein UABAM_04612 [Candidatus Uabimicrobium amorphum]
MSKTKDGNASIENLPTKVFGIIGVILFGLVIGLFTHLSKGPGTTATLIGLLFALIGGSLVPLFQGTNFSEMKRLRMFIFAGLISLGLLLGLWIGISLRIHSQTDFMPGISEEIKQKRLAAKQTELDLEKDIQVKKIQMEKALILEELGLDKKSDIANNLVLLKWEKTKQLLENLDTYMKTKKISDKGRNTFLLEVLKRDLGNLTFDASDIYLEEDSEKKTEGGDSKTGTNPVEMHFAPAPKVRNQLASLISGFMETAKVKSTWPEDRSVIKDDNQKSLAKVYDALTSNKEIDIANVREILDKIGTSKAIELKDNFNSSYEDWKMSEEE